MAGGKLGSSELVVKMAVDMSSFVSELARAKKMLEAFQKDAGKIMSRSQGVANFSAGGHTTGGGASRSQTQVLEQQARRTAKTLNDVAAAEEKVATATKKRTKAELDAVPVDEKAARALLLQKSEFAGVALNSEKATQAALRYAHTAKVLTTDNAALARTFAGFNLQTEIAASRTRQLNTELSRSMPSTMREAQAMAKNAIAKLDAVRATDRLVTATAKLMNTERYHLATEEQQLIMLKKLAVQTEMSAGAAERAQKRMSYGQFAMQKAKALGTYVGVGSVMFGAINQASQGYNTWKEQEKATTYAMRTYGQLPGATRESTQAAMTAFTSKHVNTMSEYGTALYEITSAMDKYKLAAFGAKGVIDATNISLGTNIIMHGKIEDTTKTLMGLYNVFKDRIGGLTTATQKYQYISNIVLQTWRDYQIDIPEMIKSFSYAASVSKVSNLSLAEMSTIVGVLHENMVRSSTAGTSLRKTMLSLVSDRGKVTESIKKVNESLNLGMDMKTYGDPSKQLSPLQYFKALRDAMSATAGVKPGEKFGYSAQTLKVLEKSFGDRALPGVVALLENIDQIIEKSKKADEEARKLGTTFSQMLSTAEGDPAQQLEIMKKGIDMVAAGFVQGIIGGKDFQGMVQNVNKNMDHYIERAAKAGKEVKIWLKEMAPLGRDIALGAKAIAGFVTHAGNMKAILNGVKAAAYLLMAVRINEWLGSFSIGMRNSATAASMLGPALRDAGSSAVVFSNVLNGIKLAGFAMVLSFTTSKVLELIDAIHGAIEAQNQLSEVRAEGATQKGMLTSKYKQTASAISGFRGGAINAGTIMRPVKGGTQAQFLSMFNPLGGGGKQQSAYQGEIGLRAYYGDMKRLGGMYGIRPGELASDRDARVKSQLARIKKETGQSFTSTDVQTAYDQYRLIGTMFPDIINPPTKPSSSTSNTASLPTANLPDTGAGNKGPKPSYVKINPPAAEKFDVIFDRLIKSMDNSMSLASSAFDRKMAAYSAVGAPAMSRGGILWDRGGMASSRTADFRIGQNNARLSWLGVQQRYAQKELRGYNREAKDIESWMKERGINITPGQELQKSSALVPQQYQFEYSKRAERYNEVLSQQRSIADTLRTIAADTGKIQDNTKDAKAEKIRLRNEQISRNLGFLLGKVPESMSKSDVIKRAREDYSNTNWNRGVQGSRLYQMMPERFGERINYNYAINPDTGQMEASERSRTMYMKSTAQMHAEAYANGWLKAKDIMANSITSSVTSALKKGLGDNMYVDILAGFAEEYSKMLASQMFSSMALNNGLFNKANKYNPEYSMYGSGAIDAAYGGAETNAPFAATGGVGAINAIGAAGGALALGGAVSSIVKGGYQRSGGGAAGLASRGVGAASSFMPGGLAALKKKGVADGGLQGLHGFQGMQGFDMASGVMSLFQIANKDTRYAGIGGLVGSAFGPVGSMVGGLLGGLLDKKKKKPEIPTADKAVDVKVVNLVDIARELSFVLPESTYYSGRVRAGVSQQANRSGITIGTIVIGPGASEADGAAAIRGMNAAAGFQDSDRRGAVVSR